MLPVKIYTEPGVKFPEYKTEGSAGFDIASNEDEIINLSPGERRLIHTGIYLEIPVGYELQIRPRSGLSLKNGFVPVLGTIDNDYRGEIGIIAMNLSTNTNFTVKKGDRIAQGVISPVISAFFKQVDSVDKLSKTERGTGGFGSTGI